MDQSSLSHVYRFSVDALNSSAREKRMRELLAVCLKDAPGGQKLEIDTGARTLVILSSEPLDVESFKKTLVPEGFHLKEKKDAETLQAQTQTSSSALAQEMIVCVDGMTCQACELTVERKWKKLQGVNAVEVNATKGKATLRCTGSMPSIAELQKALGEDTYTVSLNGSLPQKTKPTFLRLVGLFALVFLVGGIVTKLGLLKTNFTVGSGMSFGAIFIVGLVAASSSCIAIVGGLLLSSAAKFNERYASAVPMARMRPVLLFVIGRVIGYTVLGGLLGVVGKALTPSPLITALIAIIAALYMLVMGLDMLGIAPAWLKGLTPRMPKVLSRRVMDAEGKEHPLAPLALGAATFFLPCGFTQAFQLYALTTASFATGALTLLAFALGTAPALLALGWASSSIKGKIGKFFFQFSGALVVVLGLWNIQNGLAIAGYPLSLPSFTLPASNASTGNAAANVVSDGQTQIMRMAVGYSGYSPNRFTIKAGLPTRWEIDGTNAGGCGSVIQSRALGIQKALSPGQNVIAFTAPQQPGTYQFSCSMGMYRGQITVVPNT